MGHKILLITTDQQRFDALGCNGGRFAKTPNLDGLAAAGINFSQARNQSTVCMPARSTILTGQSIRRHGVTSNGIQLPPEENSLAHVLQDGGYKTALIGKAHLDPHAGKIFFENTAATNETTGPYRGFDHMELCGHTGRAGRSLFHYPKWLAENYPEFVGGSTNTLSPARRRTMDGRKRVRHRLLTIQYPLRFITPIGRLVGPLIGWTDWSMTRTGSAG